MWISTYYYHHLFILILKAISFSIYCRVEIARIAETSLWCESVKFERNNLSILGTVDLARTEQLSCLWCKSVKFENNNLSVYGRVKIARIAETSLWCESEVWKLRCQIAILCHGSTKVYKFVHNFQSLMKNAPRAHTKQQWWPETALSGTYCHLEPTCYFCPSTLTHHSEPA